jgi:two-component system sensor histidine kinase/response regulator
MNVALSMQGSFTHFPVEQRLMAATAMDSEVQGIVLLVDDTPTNLGVLFDSLQGSGFKLLAAQDGESAIAQVGHLKPDVILLDVMMPGIDGFETCRRLKENPETRDIPVIFMTALTDTVDKVRGFTVGAVDYITKPFQPEEVLARIRAHVAVQRLQQQLREQNQKLQREIEQRSQAEYSLRILLNAVAHDLKNPVTGILMVLKNLLHPPEKSVRNGHQRQCSRPAKTLGPHPTPPAAENSTISNMNSAISLSASAIRKLATNGAIASDYALELCANNVTAQAAPADVIPVSRRLLERMLDSGNHQLALINGLLEAHSLATQGLALHCEALSLAGLGQNVLRELEPHLIKNQATVSNQIPSTLPQVKGDATQLWRVLEHLICNAVKHNAPGRSLVLDATLQGDFIKCSITDDGTGIAPEQREQLFELHRRGINTRHTHGLGLGLYLCRQIIQSHGGEIGVDSVLHQGATFWFTLPIQST